MTSASSPAHRVDRDDDELARLARQVAAGRLAVAVGDRLHVPVDDLSRRRPAVAAAARCCASEEQGNGQDERLAHAHS
jgi:hypothetical protein